MSSYAFILVGGIERFIVLVGVEAMAERLKLDSDLRQRFEDTEAYLHFLTTTMGKLPSPDQVPTGTDTAATLPS